MNRIHALLNMLRREQQSLEQADYKVNDILDLERRMQKVEQQIASEIDKCKGSGL